MNIHLLQRLQLLLQLVKDERLCATARENLAAAKELVDAAYMLGDIGEAEYRHLRSLCIHAQIDTSNHEIERVRSVLPKTYTSFSDGVRAVKP